MIRSRRGDLNFEDESEEQYQSRAVRLSDISSDKKKSKGLKGNISVSSNALNTDNGAPNIARAVGEVLIYAIEAMGDEGCVRICLEALDSGVKSSVTVTVGQFADLKIGKGIIDKEKHEELLFEGDVFRAIRQGMTFLSYGDKSEKMLDYKLKTKGFDRRVSEAAVRYFVDNGFLCENDGACRLASLCAKKYWGKMRIRSELIAKGYSSDAVSSALESLCDVDFSGNCYLLICKKYRSADSSPEGRKKLSAALARYGYTYGEIREATDRFFRGK